MSKADVKFPSSGGGTPYALDVEDEGSVILSNPGAINFVGAGVSVQENPFPSGTAEVTINGFTFDVQYNDVVIETDPPYLNFKGLGVQALGVPGGGVDVTVFSGINIDDEGSQILSNPDTLNFTGAGVIVTESPSGTAAINIPGGSVIAINTQTATPYTLVLSDAGKLIRMNLATANTVTIPPNSSVNFAVGTVLYVEQMGAGTTTIGAGVGVTINTAAVNSPYQYGTLTLIQVSADVWNVIGGTV